MLDHGRSRALSRSCACHVPNTPNRSRRHLPCADGMPGSRRSADILCSCLTTLYNGSALAPFDSRNTSSSATTHDIPIESPSAWCRALTSTVRKVRFHPPAGNTTEPLPSAVIFPHFSCHARYDCSEDKSCCSKMATA